MTARLPRPLTAIIVVAAAVAAVAAGVSVAPAPARSQVSPHLVDVTEAAGIDVVHGAFRWGATADPAAMMGGGVCWLDADGDGWLDLYLPNTWSEGEHARWVAEGTLPTSTLYRNVEGRFVDVGAETGAALQVRAQGCLAADLDGDTHTDLLVTSDRRSTLLWNDGDGTFTVDDGSAGLHRSGWHPGAAAGDVDGDGRLDVVLTGYVDPNTRIEGSAGGFPRTHRPVGDVLLRNTGPAGGARAVFEEVSAAAGLDAGGARYGLGATFADVDADGDLDLLVANDTDPDRLYRNDSTPGAPRLVDVAVDAGVDDDGAGMGVAVGDVDGDALADLLVTNLGEQRHALHGSDGGATLRWVDGRASLGVPTLGEGLTGWGIALADLDGDADDDVLYAHGAIPIGADRAATAQPLLAYTAGADGLVLDRSAFGVDRLGPHNARGSAVADWDNDGDPDLVVVGVGEAPVLLQNQGQGGGWLRVEPAGLVPGTTVAVALPDGRVRTRTVTAGSSYLSTEDPRPLVGVGTAERVTVTVTWPDGHAVEVTDVATGQVLEVARDGQTTTRTGAIRRDIPPPTVACADRSREAPSAVARWIDHALEAIRHDLPDPTHHARTLYHLSAAMWDVRAVLSAGVPHALLPAGAADGPVASAVTAAGGPTVDRRVVEAAMAQAAHDVLVDRYGAGRAAAWVRSELPAALAAECLGPADEAARAVGAAVAVAVLARTAGDGSADRPVHVPVNDPLVVRLPGTRMADPDRWQPLQLDRVVTQNGIPQPAAPQTFLGYGWGAVEPFALPDVDPTTGLRLDPGPPPRLTDPDGGAALREQVVEVIAASAALDPTDGVVLDTGAGAVGNNALGSDEGTGHPQDPVTGEAWPVVSAARGDVGRVLAELWADGPDSETPPGHWNVIARQVTDVLPPAARRIGGQGPAVDRLTWEASLHLVLNGALHDAAVAAWGVKTAYDSSRPISLVRHLGGLGQSTDPALSPYDPDGLPLVPDLIEVRDGEVVVRSWRPGEGVAWVPAAQWVPYQQPTFVSPAFAGYVSGHSTFSRAAAVVLTEVTGSPWMPEGARTTTVPAGSLAFEGGPSADVVLTWGTYADAADQAGRSRIHGGIHIRADDHAGRRLGAEVGRLAWAHGQTLLTPR